MITPDFSAWEGLREASTSWYNNPLLKRGGVAAIAGITIWQLGHIAQQFLQSQTLSETARVMGCSGTCILLVIAMGLAAWFVRSGEHNAPNQETRKRPPQPGDQPSGP